MLTVQNLSHDPFYNQAFEEYIYQTYQDDDIFLLWQNSPAVVVGSYQNICREVHVEALRQRGIPVVRRISGGRSCRGQAARVLGKRPRRPVRSRSVRHPL